MPPINFSFFRSKPSKPVPPPPFTTYYLASSPSSSSSTEPLLHPIPPNGTARPLPSTSLIFAFIHPDPSLSEPTAFFLRALPDPIGFAFHAANFAATELRIPGDPARWRHQLIEIELEDKEGLAATCGGHIGVSLHWVADIMRQVKKGERDEASAAKEFKGVLLHELVHTIQHDGNGSTPTWLTESIADHVRLNANLGPPHWRQPGQGRRDRGWEDAYDAGARFLSWLTGPSTSTPPSNFSQYPYHNPPPSAAPYGVGGAPPPAPTMYPNNPPPPIPPRPDADRSGKPRRGPFPDIVRLIDVRLSHEQWDDVWWEEMAGARLEVLWKEYLDYYA